MDNYESYKELYTIQDLKETNFEDREKNQPHQTEWEVILGGYLLENSFKLKKDNSNLDFLVNFVNEEFYIEATAPTEGNGHNKVINIPCNEHSFFKDCIRNDDKIILRLTSCIKSKIEQIEKKNFDKNKIVILAINGAQCIKDWETPNEPFPFIVRCLYGLGHTCVTCDSKPTYDLSKQYFKGAKKIEIAQIFPNDTIPINGIIFSNITKQELVFRGISKNDFLYIQNPARYSLTNIFEPYMNIFKTAKNGNKLILFATNEINQW